VLSSTMTMEGGKRALAEARSTYDAFSQFPRKPNFFSAATTHAEFSVELFTNTSRSLV
jgi:hypothetical protein